MILHKAIVNCCTVRVAITRGMTPAQKQGVWATWRQQDGWSNSITHTFPDLSFPSTYIPGPKNQPANPQDYTPAQAMQYWFKTVLVELVEQTNILIKQYVVDGGGGGAMATMPNNYCITGTI